jgi:hypothetical protein
VVDNGSGMCKAGFAGDDARKFAIFPGARVQADLLRLRLGLHFGVLESCCSICVLIAFQCWM